MEYRELSQSWMCINKGMVLKGVVWKSGCVLPFFFFFLPRQAGVIEIDDFSAILNMNIL